ncbi:MFAP2 protein, partial [Ptilorrhoa leucosticta]|nr:MFAP2 protein [Ptilorrhoa leucosticta]
ALLAQGQYGRFEGITYPEPVQYSQYDQQAVLIPLRIPLDGPVRPLPPPEPGCAAGAGEPRGARNPPQFPIPVLPADCREEQYPPPRLYSVHKPCKQCLNEICPPRLRRVYVINKEICVRTVCAPPPLLRADLCRDKFSKCGVMAPPPLCQTVGASCARSCGGC